MKSLFVTLALLIGAQSAMAFGHARVKTPVALDSFTTINELGETALAEIQQKKWARGKIVTVLANTPKPAQILVRQTAKISLDRNILAIDSSAGYSVINGSFIGELGQVDKYSSQVSNAPVIYKGQRVLADGTVQVAIGVDYKKGGAVDKNSNKIRLTMYENDIFSGPNSYDWNEKVPDFASNYVQQLVQYVVISWNQNNPNVLTVNGISNSESVVSQFSTVYSAE